MKLTAVHRDGFTEHLVSWTLVAAHGIASVSARWFDGAGGAKREFTLDFPDDRIHATADKLRGLKPAYDATIDDFPHYESCIENDEQMIRVHVADSLDWDDDDRRDIESFMEAWTPIYRDVERMLAIPGRHND